MQNLNNPLSVRISVFLLLSIPVQLFFWSVYHTLHAGGALGVNEMAVLALMGGGYGILALGLSRRKKWAHRGSVVILALMSLTSVIKLMKGLSSPSPGYLLFLVTYLVSLVFLLTPSSRKAFPS